jgi:hypothetical protein
VASPRTSAIVLVLAITFAPAMPAFAQDQQPLGTDPSSGGPTAESIERAEEIRRRLRELKEKAEEERRAREEQRALNELMRREQQQQ